MQAAMNIAKEITNEVRTTLADKIEVAGAEVINQIIGLQDLSYHVALTFGQEELINHLTEPLHETIGLIERKTGEWAGAIRG